MPEHKGATAINDLRGAFVKAQHNLDDKSALWEMIEHLSGVGHLEVLGLAKGQAPVKGDYEKWLKTEAGKTAQAHAKLNSAYNAIVPKIMSCYSAAAKEPPNLANIKANAGKAVKLAEEFLHTYHIPTKHWTKIQEKINEVKKYQ